MSEAAPADITGNEDMGAREVVFPSQSGTLFTCVEIDPRVGVEEPGWHATDTIDYIGSLAARFLFT